MESRPDPVHRTRRSSVWITLVAVLVLIIISGSLFALRSVLFENHNAGPGHTPGVTTPLSTPTPTSVVTQQVPPTQTDCPTANTARAMITAPLAQGKDPQIVYIPQTGNDITTRTRIMRYDTVTHSSTELFKISSGMIGTTILSADGQWLLIRYEDVAPPSAHVRLQALRIDGQGLQTLYCGDVAQLTWSPDRHWIAFDGSIQAYGVADTIHMIDTTSGQFLSEVDIPDQYNASNPHNPRPAFWLSNTELYLEDWEGARAPFNTYLVDTANGEHQSQSSLQVVSQQPYTYASYKYTESAVTDGTNLFVDEITCSNGASSCPGNMQKTALVRMPAHGGTSQVIFQDPQLFIDGIGLVNAQHLMVVASNQSKGIRELWLVKSDGSAQTLLTSAKAVFGTGSSQVDAYSGGVVLSPDGQHFVVTEWPTADGTSTQAFYGSPDSSTLTPLDTNGDNVLSVLGWIQL